MLHFTLLPWRQVGKPYFWKQIRFNHLRHWIFEGNLEGQFSLVYIDNVNTPTGVLPESGWVRVPQTCPAKFRFRQKSLADWRVTNGPCGQWLPSSATCCSDRQLWLCDTSHWENQLKLASWSGSAELQFWLKTGWVGSDQWSMWSAVAWFSEHAQRNYDSDVSLA